MNVTKKILSLLALLLLTSAITSIYAQNTPTVISSEVEGVQQLSGMTIFNSENFYAADNAIAIQNGYAQVLKNDINSEVLSVSASPPKLVANNSLNKLKTTRKQLKKVVTKTQKPEEKNNTPQFIAWGNSPYNNNSYFAGANNFFAVLPSTTTKKSTTNIHLVCHFDEGEIAFANLLKAIEQNQLFQSHETIIIPNNYSKTSRIRPPPFI